MTAAQRRARVVELRADRWTFAQIGAELGISRQRAHQLYDAVLASYRPRDLDLHRTEELELIDAACRDLLEIARDRRTDEDGILVVSARDRAKAWEVLRAWADRKARLLGLDEPKRSHISMERLDEMLADVQAELDRTDP
jgi:hypothetical protein